MTRVIFAAVLLALIGCNRQPPETADRETAPIAIAQPAVAQPSPTTEPDPDPAPQMPEISVSNAALEETQRNDQERLELLQEEEERRLADELLRAKQDAWLIMTDREREWVEELLPQIRVEGTAKLYDQQIDFVYGGLGEPFFRETLLEAAKRDPTVRELDAMLTLSEEERIQLVLTIDRDQILSAAKRLARGEDIGEHALKKARSNRFLLGYIMETRRGRPEHALPDKFK